MARETVSHHPDVGIAANRAGESVPYQLWLILRFMDTTGRGWIEQETAYRHLAEEESDWQRYRRARLRQVLDEGNGRYWSLSAGRIWLRSLVKIAASLGIDHLSGRFVEATADDVTGRIQAFRAYLFAAWLANHDGPMTQATIERLTGIPARTQRQYRELAGVETTENIAVGPVKSKANEQECHWHYAGAFTFTDHNGRQGPVNRTYMAWHLPSSYTSDVATGSRSRQRRANKKLADLPKTGAAGNGQNPRRDLARRFHESGKAAAQAARRADAGDEHYWRWSRSRTGRYLWHRLIARAGSA